MGDYFIWESRRRDVRSALVSEFPPTFEEHGVNFLAGRRFLFPLPELELRIPPMGDGVPSDDLVVFAWRCIGHSDKLIGVMRQAGVDNIDYHPLRIVREITGDVYRTHQAANILDVIFCIDRKKSNLYINDEDPYHLWFIDRLVLMEERLGDALCFRLGERPSTVIVHRRVKEAVEAAGMSGPVFLPAEGYREYRGFSVDNPRNVIGTHDDDPDGPADLLSDEGQDEQDGFGNSSEWTEAS
jgi:uncharacterized protein DUF1629